MAEQTAPCGVKLEVGQVWETIDGIDCGDELEVEHIGEKWIIGHVNHRGREAWPVKNFTNKRGGYRLVKAAEEETWKNSGAESGRKNGSCTDIL